jgi:NADH:ubiquinone oxidoreductase subunit 3 (subunit A)
MVLLYVVLDIEIYITHIHTFIVSLLFTVLDKIIMLVGTWRTTRENSATTRSRVVWDALG